VGKIKRRKLRWTGSESPQVVGYKLYWEENGDVTYNSSYAVLGNVTEVVLPDDVQDFKTDNGPIEFGIAAMDELGNESDMITVSAPYQFKIPHAPEGIWLEGSESSSQEESQQQASEKKAEIETDPLAFLDHDFDGEAVVHRLPDNIVGNHSSENRPNVTAVLKQRVDRL
jgi:hypothetical protein